MKDQDKKKAQMNRLYLTAPALTVTLGDYESAQDTARTMVAAARAEKRDVRIRVRPRRDGTFDVVTKVATEVRPVELRTFKESRQERATREVAEHANLEADGERS